ncbi:MAG: multicopper oxidase family protein [Bryobacteraceae bacterium]
MPLLDPRKDKWLAKNILRPLTIATPKDNDFDGADYYEIAMQPIRHTFHPKLRNIPMWSYGSTSPGEVIVAQPGKPVRVLWLNGLAGQSLSSLIEFGDRQGMESDHALSICHNQVHLHGARVPGTSDGFPEEIFHPNEGRAYYYPNVQAASTLWYHDHAMDVTRLNVYAGLFGGYILRDPQEDALLPSGALEMTLILQDKSFSGDGKKLYYEQSVDRTKDPAEATPEFLGDYPLVNGQIWPLLELEPRIYRFRLLNGANTRFFNLFLTTPDDPTTSVLLHVIAMEGGFLPKPVPTTRLLLAPGERADVLVDLRAYGETALILRNDAPIPYSGDPADPQFQADDYGPLDASDNCAELMKLSVDGRRRSADAAYDPATIKLPKRKDPLPGPPPPSSSDFAAIEAACNAVPIDAPPANLAAGGIAFKLRRFVLEEVDMEMPTLPGVPVPNVQINGKSWHDAGPVEVAKDGLEVWEFVNLTPDTHPMHLHLVQFQTMSRIRLDTSTTPPTYVSPAPVDTWEQGFKDTVRCNPSQSTRLLVRFDGYAGHYVYHCHILEHEDMGMMFRVDVGVSHIHAKAARGA